MEYICCWTLSKSLAEKEALVKPKTRKLAVVGDSGCGKTSLIYRFTRDRTPHPGEQVTTLETDEVAVYRNGKQTNLILHDSSGTEDYAKVRALAYKESDVILVCFSIDSPVSLDHVISEWTPEVRTLCPKKPFLLVGLKKDLREHSILKPKEMGKLFVTEKQGRRAAKTIGAVAYFECSAHDNTDEGKAIKRIFGRALRESLK